MKRFFYPHRYVVNADQTAKMKHMALEDALKRLSVIDQRLKKQGPYYLGANFSLVDIMLSYWTEYIDPASVLDQFNGVNECRSLVTSRPLLAPCFKQLRLMREEYVKIQAEGMGVT